MPRAARIGFRIALAGLLLAASAATAQVRTVLQEPSTAVPVHAVALSPDGKTAAWGGVGKVRIGEAKTGKVLAEWNVPATRFVFTHDGKRVIGLGTGFAVWDVAAGKESLRTKTVATDAVPTADPDAVVLTNFAGRVWVADLATGAERAVLQTGTAAVGGVTYSPDGKWVAAGDAAGKVRTWDRATGKPGREFGTGGSAVSQLEFTSDGETLTASRADGTVHLWNTADGTLRAEAKGRARNEWTVAFTADGNVLAFYTPANSIEVWDLRAARRQITINLPADFSGSTVLIPPDGNTLHLTPATRGEIAVLDATTGKEVTRVPRGVGGADIGDGGKAVIIGTEPTGVRLYDAATGKDRGALDGLNVKNTATSCSADAKWVAAGNNDEACVWDSTNRQLRCRMSGAGRCGYMVFSPDAKFLAGKGATGSGVTLWNGETGQLVSTLPDRASGVWAYKFSPDSKELLVGTTTGGLRAFDAAGKPVRTYQQAAGSGRLASSADGSRVAFGSADGEVAVWDAKAWGEPARLKVAADAVTGLAFAPTGADVVVSARDASVAVWDAAERKLKHQLAPAGGPPQFPDPASNPVAFSRNVKAVAAGFGDGKVRVWDAATGQPTTTATGHTGAVRAVWFGGPNGVVSAALDDTVRVWDAATGAERENLRQRVPGPRGAGGPGGAVLAGSANGTLVRIEPITNAVRTLAQPSVRADRFVLSPDGSLAVLVDGERATLWPLAGDRPPVRFEPRSQVTAAFAPDGRTFALGTEAGQLELWDAKALAPVATLVRAASPVVQEALAPDGSAVAVAALDGSFFVWDAATGKARWSTPPPANRAYAQSAAFADGGKLVAVTMWDGNLKVYDAATGAEKHASTGAAFVAGHPSRPLVAVATTTGGISFWSAEGKAPRTVFRGTSVRPTTFAFCAGGKTVFLHTGTAAELWDMETGTKLAAQPATRAAVSPDGGHVVLQTARESVVLDAATGKPVGKPLVRTASTGVVEVGNGGRFAVDQAVAGFVVWETATGKPVPGIPASLRGAAVAPDGTTLAFGDANGVTVRDHAADPPKVRFTDPGTSGPVAFTADGRFLFTISSGSARAWDAATGKPVPGTSELPTTLHGTAADRVLMNDRDNALRLVTFGKGGSAVVHPGAPRPIHGLAFTPDGLGLWAAGNRGIVRYDLAERRESRSAPGYFVQPELMPAADGGVVVTVLGSVWRIPATGTGPAEAIASRSFPSNPPVSADGRWSLVADSNSWFLVDIAEKKLTETAKLPPVSTTRVSIAPNGKFLAAWPDVGGWPCRVFTFPALEERTGLDAPGRTIAVAWSPDSSRLAVFGVDGVVRLWSVPAGRFEAAVPVPGAAVTSRAGLRFSADGKRLVVGTETGALAVLDVVPGPEQAACRGHTGAVLAAAVSPDGSAVYSAAADKTIRAWNAKTGQVRNSALTPDGLVLGLAVSPDGRRLASAGADGSVRLWDVGRLRELRSWSVPGPVWCVAFTPDGSALAAGCDDGTVRIIPIPRPPWPFDERSWPGAADVASLAGSAGAVFALAYSPDGATLYAGTGTFDDLTKPGRVLRWDVATGKRGDDLGESNSAVLALAATADRVASGGADRAVTLWNPAGSAGPATLSGHKVAVRGLAFLPGGRLLSAGGVPTDPRAAGEVKVWDLATGREVPPLLGQRSGVSAVAASADGSVVVTAGWDELVRVWNFGKAEAGGAWWPWPG